MRSSFRWLRGWPRTCGPPAQVTHGQGPRLACAGLSSGLAQQELEGRELYSDWRPQRQPLLSVEPLQDQLRPAEIKSLL